MLKGKATDLAAQFFNRLVSATAAALASAVLIGLPLVSHPTPATAALPVMNHDEAVAAKNNSTIEKPEPPHQLPEDSPEDDIWSRPLRVSTPHPEVVAAASNTATAFLEGLGKGDANEAMKWSWLKPVDAHNDLSDEASFPMMQAPKEFWQAVNTCMDGVREHPERTYRKIDIISVSYIANADRIYASSHTSAKTSPDKDPKSVSFYKVSFLCVNAEIVFDIRNKENPHEYRYPVTLFINSKDNSLENCRVTDFRDTTQFFYWFFVNNSMHPETICDALSTIAPREFSHKVVCGWLDTLDSESHGAFIKGYQCPEARQLDADTAWVLTEKYRALYMLAQASNCESCLLPSAFRAATGYVVIGRYDTALEYFELLERHYDDKGQFADANNIALWIECVCMASHNHHRRQVQYEKNLQRARKANRPLDELAAECQHALASIVLAPDPFADSTRESRACEARLHSLLDDPEILANSPEYRARVHEWLAIFASERGDRDSEAGAWLQAASLWEALGKEHKNSVAAALASTGNAAMLTGKYSEALHYEEKALHIYEELKDNVGQARCLQTVGSIYYRQGNRAASEEANNKSIALTDLATGGKDAVFRMHNRATLETDSLTNLVAYFRAVGEVKAGDDDSYAAYTYEAMGEVCDYLGDHEQARYFFDLSLRLAMQNKNHAALSRTLAALASAQMRQGNWKEAEQQFTYALRHARICGDEFDISEILRYQAGLLIHQQKYEEALRVLDSQLEKTRLRGEVVEVNYLMQERAYLFFETGRLTEAESAYKALMEAKEKNLPSDYLLHFYLGQVYKEQGDADHAVEELRIAADMLETERAKIVGNSFAGALLFSQSHLHPSDDLTDIYFLLGKDWQAFQASDKSRAGSIRDAWGSAQQKGKLTEVEKIQYQLYARFIHDLGDVNRDLYRISRSPVYNRQDAEDSTRHLRQARMFVRQAQTFAEVAYLEQKRQRDVAAVPATTPPVSEPNLQERTPNTHTACLEFHVYRTLTYVFITTSDGATGRPRLQVKKLDITAEDLQKRVEEFRHYLLVDTRDTRRLPDDENERRSVKLGNTLYKDLISPCLRYLAGKDTLCIVPDSFLWRLPFCALMPENGTAIQAKRHYLIDDFAIYYIPSLTSLYEIRDALKYPRKENFSPADPYGDLLAIGDPALEQTAPYLPYAHPAIMAQTRQEWEAYFKSSEMALPPIHFTQEDSLSGESVMMKKLRSLLPLPEARYQVETLKQELPGLQTTVLKSLYADEPTIKRIAGQYRVLHFAAHAVLDDTNPLYSRIVLSQTEFRQLSVITPRGTSTSPAGRTVRTSHRQNVSDSEVVAQGYGGPLDEDGFLEAWEIAQLPLSADLVVLACCDTAEGVYNRGEGLVSLAWAFLQARTPRVIGTQWSVSPGLTTDLLLDFYRNVSIFPALHGRSRDHQLNCAKALQAAMREAKKHLATRNPRNWAGFVIIGDGE